MNPHLLAYPDKSHRKSVDLPPESSELAELLGIIYGDGGIGNPWQLVISLNSISDAAFSDYVISLLERLFSVRAVRRKRPNQNTLVVVVSSITVIDFLVGKGAVRGNKLKQIKDIPAWVLRRSIYVIPFVRGLIDTDGCIYLHNHCVGGKSYVNIGLCFTNFSPLLIMRVNEVLKKEGIKSYITDRGRRIYIYSAKEVEKYMGIFGSSNQRIISKYERWISREQTQDSF